MYFLSSIVRLSAKKRDAALKKLLIIYEFETRIKLLSSEITFGLNDLRDKTKCIPWFIVSGGDQNQLKYIFKEKSISNLFDGGIFGSPRDKLEILRNELLRKINSEEALFIGDSKYDYKCYSIGSSYFNYL